MSKFRALIVILKGILTFCEIFVINSLEKNLQQMLYEKMKLDKISHESVWIILESVKFTQPDLKLKFQALSYFQKNLSKNLNYNILQFV